MPVIRVRYFAGARDIAGQDSEVVALTGVATVKNLLQKLAERHPDLSPHLTRIRVAINDNFAELTDSIRDGDEVVLIPPVAGGSPSATGQTAHHSLAAGSRVFVDVRDGALSLDEVFARVRNPRVGGIALFLGVVRDHADGKAVERLDYEAYLELALKEMRRIGETIASESGHDEVLLAAIHRVGTLAVGDIAVIVAAGAPHRAEAFAACRAFIDRIKETVPIWKKEWETSGQSSWVNFE